MNGLIPDDESGARLAFVVVFLAQVAGYLVYELAAHKEVEKPVDGAGYVFFGARHKLDAYVELAGEGGVLFPERNFKLHGFFYYTLTEGSNRIDPFLTRAAIGLSFLDLGFEEALGLQAVQCRVHGTDGYRAAGLCLELLRDAKGVGFIIAENANNEHEDFFEVAEPGFDHIRY